MGGGKEKFGKELEISEAHVTWVWNEAIKWRKATRREIQEGKAKWGRESRKQTLFEDVIMKPNTVYVN